MKLCTIKKAWFFLFTILIFNISLSSHAALVARDLDGNLSNGHEGVYDDVLNITWLADANLAASNNFGVSGIYSANGTMGWDTAETYVAAMNADDGGAGYLSVNTWRQTSVSPVNGNYIVTNADTYDGSTDRGYQIGAAVDPIYNPLGQSAGFIGSEMSYQYYNNFGAKGSCTSISATIHTCFGGDVYGLENATNTDNILLFSNIYTDVPSPYYWNSERTLNGSSAFAFTFISGYQGTASKQQGLFTVWAVTDGDVGASMIPVPPTFWFFGSALLGLMGFKQRR